MKKQVCSEEEYQEHFQNPDVPEELVGRWFWIANGKIEEIVVEDEDTQKGMIRRLWNWIARAWRGQCVWCMRFLTTEQRFDNEGICPHCGNASDSNECDVI